MKWRRLIVLLSLAAVFLAGIGVGESLNDRPDLSGNQTLIRTLNPLPITPAATETGTITTSNP